MGISVRTHFREVAGLPAEGRSDYYSRRGVSTELRAEVESLLQFDEPDSATLTEIAGAAANRFLLSNTPVSEAGLCGPYRLIRLLGNGGMGSVYLAERADGEIQQRVAIKFLHPGASQSLLREHFLRERQILASLNHPGIARLLGAGHSAGHPYLVMEAVEGTRIDEYARQLDERGIAELVIRVAEAVSYAHRNLVVHRDIKPSNILVDAHAQPKLLDFGIAKILDADERTRTVMAAMTPDYASPEQLRGEAQATPTDIYSLGAVMRTLLADRTVPEDLAAIVSKAMRDEPEERYASVELLIADLEAYLEHRPVHARRGNALYVARKFVRRRWFSIAAAAVAVSGLAGGVLVANHERGIAQRRFQQVRQLSKQFLDLDTEVQRLPGSTKVRGKIASASREYLERLAAEATGDTDLSLELAAAYLQVARLQGVPVTSNLGQFQQAQDSLSRAERLVEPVLEGPAFPGRRRALLLSAEIARDTMILVQSDDKSAETLVQARKAVSRLDELLAMPAVTTSETASAARILVNVALALSNIHHVEEAAVYARRSVELARKAGDRRQLGRALGILSNTARYSGDVDGALAAIRESRALAEETLDPTSVDSVLQLCGATWREGLVLGEADSISLEQPHEAIPLLRRAFDLAEAAAARDPRDYASRSYVSMAGRELGDVLLTADPARALAVFEHSFRRSSEIAGNSKARREELWLLRGSANALRRLGRPDEAKRKVDQALDVVRRLRLDAGPIELGEGAGIALRALAEHHAGTGDVHAAIRVYEDLEARVAPRLSPANDLRHADSLSRLYRNLGDVYRRAGQSDRAAALRERRAAIWRPWNQKLPGTTYVKHQIELAQREISR